jgi:stage IV sporulation protein FB
MAIVAQTARIGRASRRTDGRVYLRQSPAASRPSSCPVISLDPGRTQFDLHLNVLGIPTRIHPGFWIMAFILGFSASNFAGERPQPLQTLVNMAIILVSIIVHELGHAILQRRFGFSSRIVLYHLGGLAIADQGFSGFEKRRARRDTWESIQISLAGPAAGFLLAALITLVVFLCRGSISFDPRGFPRLWNVDLPAGTPPNVYLMVDFALFVNIFWGLMNLVPVLPLDGGQVARELLTHRDPYRGLTHALQLSIGVGIVVAVVLFPIAALPYGWMMFAMLAVSNYITLQQLGRML